MFLEVNLIMLQPGILLQNRYRILRQLGGGGMGVVYLAEDSRLPGRRCAIKEMSPDQLPAPDRNWAIQAFQQEAQMLANLKHPGLTLVTDYFPEHSNWYLVMDFIEGETLEARLAKAPGGRLPVEEALRITRQLCEVLTYLHNQNPPVIFRDLKPSNVMLTLQGEVKLIDFGIARFFKPGQTRDTVNLGTPGYAAPEQYGKMGLQSGPRADVYSLGALLLQMISGYDPTLTPFPLPDPRSVMRNIPPHIAAVITQATQATPDLRYGSIREMQQALFPPIYLIQPQPTTLPFAWTEDLKITLSFTLEKAIERAWYKQRQALVGNLLTRILQNDSIEGHFTILVGYSGTGITTIIEQLKTHIMQHRKHKWRTIISHVKLIGSEQSIDPGEVLRDLKRRRGMLKLRLRRAVLRAYHQHNSSSSFPQRESTQHLKVGLPIEFTVNLPLVGTLKLGQPIEYEAASTTRSASPELSKPEIAQQHPLLLSTLRELVDYLIEHEGRVILVLDKVNTPDEVKLLQPLLDTPGVYTIITADTLEVGQWESSKLARHNLYVPCLWDFAQDIVAGLLENNAQRDTREMQEFIDYLNFKGRGILRRYVETLCEFYIPSSKQTPGYSKHSRPQLFLPT